MTVALVGAAGLEWLAWSVPLAGVSLALSWLTGATAFVSTAVRFPWPGLERGRPGPTGPWGACPHCRRRHYPCALACTRCGYRLRPPARQC